MGERRMLAKTICESDAFLELTPSARFLYVDLNLNADDDGFVNAPKKICRMVGATEEDLGELTDRKFVLFFPEKGVVVIKHWWIHNTIKADRHKPTKYQDIMQTLRLDENRAYTLNADCVQAVSVLYPKCFQLGAETEPYVRLSKDKRSKDKLRGVTGERSKPVYDDSGNPPTDPTRLAELLAKRS